MNSGIAVLVCAVLASWAGAAPRGGTAATAPTGPTEPPAISTLVKPEVYARMTTEREIMSNASLDEIATVTADTKSDKAPLKRYSFYAGMLVRAGLPETRAILVDYKLYQEMVPFVEKAEFDASAKLLELRGGVLGWKLRSWVRFEERGDRWIRFIVAGGHFMGLAGDLILEPRGEQGVLVLVRGGLEGRKWPPAFILERGAEIAFGFTTEKMRSYIEARKRESLSGSGVTAPHGWTPPEGPGKQDEGQIPQPRGRL